MGEADVVRFDLVYLGQTGSASFDLSIAGMMPTTILDYLFFSIDNDWHKSLHRETNCTIISNAQWSKEKL